MTLPFFPRPPIPEQANRKGAEEGGGAGHNGGRGHKGQLGCRGEGGRRKGRGACDGHGSGWWRGGGVGGCGVVKFGWLACVACGYDKISAWLVPYHSASKILVRGGARLGSTGLWEL